MTMSEQKPEPPPYCRLVYYGDDWVEVWIRGRFVREGHLSDLEPGWLLEQVTGVRPDEVYPIGIPKCWAEGCERQGRLRAGVTDPQSPRYCHAHWREHPPKQASS